MSKSGMAIPIVLIFAFITSGLLAILLSTGSRTMEHNKLTLYNMQAHYLAQSALQHLKLKLQHLPRETRLALTSGQSTPPFTFNVYSPRRPVTDFAGINHPGNYVSNYTLFGANTPGENQSPIHGYYQFVSLQPEATARDFVQESYIATVTARVSCGCGPNTCGMCQRLDSSGATHSGFPYEVTITERVYMSRD